MFTIWANLWGWFTTPHLTEPDILQAMMTGSSLKSKRDIMGYKSYHLVNLDGVIIAVHKNQVESLRQQGLIMSNHKFPGATYLLTDKGRDLVLTLTQATHQPIHARLER